MKSCPTCNRTFSDETLSFCLVDGAILSAPFDPQATLVIPEPQRTEPTTTEVLNLEETKQEIPPTVASPQPEQKAQRLVSSIAAPAPKVDLPHYSSSTSQSEQESKPTFENERAKQRSIKYLLIIGVLLALLTVYTQATFALIMALIVLGSALLIHIMPARKSNTLAWVFIMLGTIFILIFVFSVIRKSGYTRPTPQKIDAMPASK